jgi:hypothetical protein
VALTPEQREELRSLYSAEAYGWERPTSYEKPHLLAVIDAVDDWIEANSASFNAALPQPFRGEASPQDKLRVFHLVARARFGG